MRKIYFKQMLTTLLLLCSSAVSAHDFEADGIYYNIIDATAKTVAVTFKGPYYGAYPNEYSGFVNIPQNVTYNETTYNVISIEPLAFKDCTGLTDVAIPNSITSMGLSAFGSCTNFTSLHINDLSAWCKIELTNSSITKKSWELYLNGEKMRTMVIPSDITEIKDYAFYGCSGLTSITIPNSVTSIGSYAFSGCSGLASVTIGNNVTKIGNYVFRGCSGLTSITIPNSVTTIGSGAFSGCTGLTSVTIPNSVTTIENYAFDDCSGLASVTIGNNVTKIGNNAFSGCEALKSVFNNSSLNITAGSSKYGRVASYANVVINKENIDNYNIIDEYIFTTIDSVTTLVAYTGAEQTISLPRNYNGGNYAIGNNAFSYCINLKGVTIPNSVTKIGDYAFFGCTGLISVTIPNSVTTIGEYAFTICRSLISANIGDGVNSIGSKAFSGCTGLKTIIIGESVTSIGNDAFKNCDGVACVFNKSSLIVLEHVNAVIHKDNVDKYDIVGDYVFTTANDIHLLLAYIGVDSIITLPENYNFRAYKIEDDVFKNCYNLKKVIIGDSVTSIGNASFWNCTGLTSITIPNSVTTIGIAAFRDCTALTSATIGNSVTSIGGDAFYNCTGLTSVTIPNSVTSIGGDAFYNCTGLTSVTIPNSVTTIGIGAFYGCSGLTSITIPNSVTTIESSAFRGCKGLTSVTIPNSVTAIERYAFYGCKGLTSVTIPNSVTSIGNDAFYNCDGLTDIEIGNSVTYIGKEAFCDCHGLTSVTIPNSVTTIGMRAFSSCSNLTEIHSEAIIPPTIDSKTFYIFNYAAATLFVPAGSKEAYQAADYWEKFTNIVEVSIKIPVDINSDGIVDVADVTKVVSMILDESQSSDTGDVNGDGIVDVADITKVISVILGSDTANAALAKAATRAGATSTVSAEIENNELFVNITNPTFAFSAIQFDIVLPEGIEVDFDGEYYAVDLGSRTNNRRHSYPECAIQPDGSLRVVIVSMSNALYNGTEGDVAVASLKVDGLTDGRYEYGIKNVTIANEKSQKEVLEAYTAELIVANGVTGIGSIDAEGTAADGAIYDLAGRKVNSTVKGGIYIQNGKKFVAE